MPTSPQRSTARPASHQSKLPITLPRTPKRPRHHHDSTPGRGYWVKTSQAERETWSERVDICRHRGHLPHSATALAKVLTQRIGREDGRLDLSHRRMAELAGISYPTVQRVLNAMEKLRLIWWQRRTVTRKDGPDAHGNLVKQDTNAYVLMVDPDWTAPAPRVRGSRRWAAADEHHGDGGIQLELFKEEKAPDHSHQITPDETLALQRLAAETQETPANPPVPVESAAGLREEAQVATRVITRDQIKAAAPSLKALRRGAQATVSPLPAQRPGLPTSSEAFLAFRRAGYGFSEASQAAIRAARGAIPLPR